MSAVKVRAALETALAAVTPPLPTAYENQTFAPPIASDPYQRCNVLFAAPANVENTASHEERGYMQVTLCYPTGKGAGDASQRAEAVRAAFPRGRTIPIQGASVLIPNTPEIMPGFVDGDRFCIPVRVRFSAQITV